MVNAKVEGQTREQELVFSSFVESDAWEIGSLLREWVIARLWPVLIDIRLFDRPLFLAALPGATADNFDWVRRKSNVVQRFHCSSLAMCGKLDASGATLAGKYRLDDRDFAASGGAVPILVRGCAGPIGSVTVSGLKQEDDHALVVKAIATHLQLGWAAQIELPS